MTPRYQHQRHNNIKMDPHGSQKWLKHLYVQVYFAHSTKGPSPQEGTAENAVRPIVNFPPKSDQLEDEMLLPADSFWLTNHPNLVNCSMELPRFDSQGRHPFHFQTIAEYQQKDVKLKDQLAASHAANGPLFTQQLGGNTVICTGRLDRA